MNKKLESKTLWKGLLIAEELTKLEQLLPSKRLGWRFPDNFTFVLPLTEGAIWLYNRPPNARIAYQKNFPSTEKTHSGFQDLLVSRTSGSLENVKQVKLDRVIKLYFTAQEGFVKTEPVVLITELTGRNCNLILTDANEVILGAARNIGSEINRHRQVHSGLIYTPPPPYEKLDPRNVSEEILQEALLGQQLKSLRKLIDGVGPDLTRTLAIKLGISNNYKLAKEDITKLIPVLRELSRHPTKLAKQALDLPDIKNATKTRG